MPSKLPEFATAFATYRAVTQIGEGGAGRVYECIADDQRYAVKLLTAAGPYREKARRFKNEILFGLRHRHPHIVSIVDHGVILGQGDSQPFYVMPMHPGSLRNALDAGIAHALVLPLFSSILKGIDAAHKLSVVHRDIKPENILVDDAGNPLLADFGIARFTADEVATLVETKETTRLANFLYSAPEQRRPGNTVDQRADIFALGLILNEMFTGAIPQGASYRTVSSVAPAFGYLDELIARMIAQDPNDRLGSIDEVNKVLIGRQLAFVTRQKLDALTNTVVPAAESTDPLVANPVRYITGAWNGSELEFTLSAKPPADWFALLTSESLGESFYMNFSPARMRPSGDKVLWPSSQSTAQGQIDQFKKRVEIANRHYISQKKKEAERLERNARKAIEDAAQAERDRLAMNNNLRF